MCMQIGSYNWHVDDIKAKILILYASFYYIYFIISIMEVIPNLTSN